MHYPTAIQVSNVAAVFERLAAEYDEHVASVDMAAPGITRRALGISHDGRENYCTACHAGWFALGVTKDVRWSLVDDAIDGIGIKDACYPEGNAITWDAGVHAMVKMLGFETPQDIESFFGSRGWTWGNTDGDDIFNNAVAFGSAKFYPTLEDLALHWQGVVKRITKIEAEMARTGKSFDEVEIEFLRNGVQA